MVIRASFSGEFFFFFALVKGAVRASGLAWKRVTVEQCGATVPLTAWEVRAERVKQAPTVHWP